MKSLDELMKLYEVLNNEGISTHRDIKEHYEDRVKPIVESDVFKTLLKIDITAFLDLLFDNTPYIYYKKIVLEHMTKGRYNPNTLYMLSLYSGGDKSYRNLPLLLNGLIEKLDIEKYRFCTFEDIISRLYSVLDVRTFYYSKDADHLISEISYKLKNYKYDKYEDNHNAGKFNMNDIEDFSIWAEKRVHFREAEKFKDETEGFSMWVAHDYGDGYGFDILTVDKKNQKESLIEVKTGNSRYFDLTENELKVMRNCHFKNADYYVYKYSCLPLGGYPIDMIDKYQYIPELDMLCDDYGNYYEIVLSGYKSEDIYGNEHNKYTIRKIEKENSIQLQKTI